MPASHLIVFTFAINPAGEKVIVKVRVPISELIAKEIKADKDFDFSMLIASGESKLTSRSFNCLGSFLETEPVAKLVNLDACKLVI